jgi:folate-dependent phosphoribosylglycinamide formyltransferase PurN
MLKPLFNRSGDKLRVAGLISGSGKSLISIIEKQKELEKLSACNFEVVGLFSDNIKSKADDISKQYGIPVFVNDLKEFYRTRNKKITNKSVRREFDLETIDFLNSLKPDIVIYAGYIWATTAPLVNAFQSINCHPADLSVEDQGRRLYAGANGVRDALIAGEKQLFSSLHVVTAEIDHGPILMISEPVHVENDDPELDLKDRSRKYLRLLNDKSRDLCALGIEKISDNAFAVDSEGLLYYYDKPIPCGYRLG